MQSWGLFQVNIGSFHIMTKLKTVLYLCEPPLDKPHQGELAVLYRICRTDVQCICLSTIFRTVRGESLQPDVNMCIGSTFSALLPPFGTSIAQPCTRPIG